MPELPHQSNSDDLGHLILVALRELGAERRAASLRMPEGVPGRLSEPLWTTGAIRVQLGRRSSRVPGEKRVRAALQQLQDDGLVRLGLGMRRISMWGLSPDGRRLIGEANRRSYSARILEALRTAPDGLTIPELAHALGCHHNSLYRVLPRLRQEGSVVKLGRQWKVAPDA